MASFEDLDKQGDVENRHEMLADFIKNVHRTLRQNVDKAHGDFDSVWKEHCKDKSLLKQYAEAMKELAVEHWRANNLRRIEWCRQVSVEYFHGGGQEKCLRKDCRRVLMNLDQHKNCSCVDKAEHQQQNGISKVKLDKIVILDVGSCFNPFKEFPEIFIPLAIDLCPGDKTVYTGDFLSMDVCQKQDLTVTGPDYISEQLQTCVNEGVVRQLPGDFFNVVVFCLLLSYLPAKEQRWECCKKAHQVLTDGGILLIITPDSSHQNKNVKMIKSWKTAIEAIGFVRWKYHKDEHTHCMAFRKRAKCTNFIQEQQDTQVWSEMLYINQDVQDFQEEKITTTRTEESDENFSELPFSF